MQFCVMESIKFEKVHRQFCYSENERAITLVSHFSTHKNQSFYISNTILVHRTFHKFSRAWTRSKVLQHRLNNWNLLFFIFFFQNEIFIEIRIELFRLKLSKHVKWYYKYISWKINGTQQSETWETNWKKYLWCFKCVLQTIINVHIKIWNFVLDIFVEIAIQIVGEILSGGFGVSEQYRMPNTFCYNNSYNADSLNYT